MMLLPVIKATILAILLTMAAGGNDQSTANGNDQSTAECAATGKQEVFSDVKSLLPEELKAMVLGFAFYGAEAEKLFLGSASRRPEMFEFTIPWIVFDDAGEYATISQDGKTLQETGHHFRIPNSGITRASTPAGPWVSSSSSATGTLETLGDAAGGSMTVGIVTQEGHWDLEERLSFSGRRNWHYNGMGTLGAIREGPNPFGANDLLEQAEQRGLLPITNGDRVTVIMKNRQLTFKVNGEVQGTPVELPADTQVALAVSLYGRGQTARFI